MIDIAESIIGPARALFQWTVETRAGSGAGSIALHLLEPQSAGLEAIAVVLWARTENCPDRAVARHRRAVFTVNDGRGTSEQRGDHNGSFHAPHVTMGNSVRARQSRVAKPEVSRKGGGLHGRRRRLAFETDRRRVAESLGPSPGINRFPARLTCADALMGRSRPPQTGN